MDEKNYKCVDRANKLKKIKELFSKFIEATKEINVLCDTNVSKNGSNENTGAISSNNGNEISIIDTSVCANVLLDKYSSPNEPNIILATKNVLSIDIGSSGIESDYSNDSQADNLFIRDYNINLGAMYNASTQFDGVPHYNINLGAKDNATRVDITSFSGTASSNVMENVKINQQTENNLNDSNSELIVIEVPYDTTNGPNAFDAENRELNIGSIVNLSAPDNTNDVMRCTADEQMNILSNDKTTVQQKQEAIFEQHSHESVLNVYVKKGSCDNSQMTVETSGRTGKRLCCLYCHKRNSKLARHLATVHKDKEEVKRFLALPKRSPERRNIQDSLRKRGTFEWNTNASLNNGVLCTSRRPNGKVLKKAPAYKICPKCVGIYTPSSFSSHFKTKCGKGVLKAGRTLSALSRTVEGRVHAKANNRLASKVFAKMIQDDIVRLIRYDWLIITYGNDLCTRYKRVSQLGMIRNKIRTAGRVFAAVKAECEFVTDFASAFRPKCFNSMLQAIIMIVGKFDPATEECGSCSPVLAAVTEIRKIGKMLCAEIIKLEEEGSKKLKTVQLFDTLMDSQQTNTMLKTVRDTQSKRKRLKIDNIPSTEDVKRLASYIESQRIKYFNQLSLKYCYSAWLELTKIMAASIIVFNRKRTGETQWILLSEFVSRKKIDKDCNLPIYTALSEHEKKIARQYSQMIIRGKLNNDVQVLLTGNMEKSIELLLKHREDAGVNNEFLFGIPSTTGEVKVINACAVLLDLSTKCDADNPESLRGTTLRKHVASYCITLNLNDAEVGDMAKHMGHSEKVHHYYYRRNGIDRDIVRMSKRLLGAQGTSEDIDGDTDDTDLEGDVNNENVKSAMKNKPVRKRKREKEEPRGQSDGIQDAKRPKKKINRKSNKSGKQKKNAKTSQVQQDVE